ncbi:MAG: 1-deoxy-D-xylulose-5-phosphate reductoisomerase [Aaplasma endosymbiont of Hyalomma asiaticum]
MKRVSIFGSTGFIGRKAVQILNNDSCTFEVEALVAKKNSFLLAAQSKTLNAKMAVVEDENQYKDLKGLLCGTGIRVACGIDGVLEAASLGIDCAVMAITGIAALLPVMKLIEVRTGTIALASKESVVCGGKLLVDSAESRGVNIIPVDSEHNALFRVLSCGDKPSKVTLTASGGPFLRWPHELMRHATLDEALVHPVWQMGKKISIDSATMVNKALEVVEAGYFFSLGHDKIDVIVHPESIVHALASYQDGVTVALMSLPDMSIPIMHALYWPEKNGIYNGQVDLTSQGSLTFLKPDLGKFPALRSGFDILKSSFMHASGIVFNAANEIAVDSFLNSEIGFSDIVNIVLCVMDKISYGEVTSLGDVMEYDSLGRSVARKVIASLVPC